MSDTIFAWSPIFASKSMISFRFYMYIRYFSIYLLVAVVSLMKMASSIINVNMKPKFSLFLRAMEWSTISVLCIYVSVCVYIYVYFPLICKGAHGMSKLVTINNVSMIMGQYSVISSRWFIPSFCHFSPSPFYPVSFCIFSVSISISPFSVCSPFSFLLSSLLFFPSFFPFSFYILSFLSLMGIKSRALNTVRHE